MQSAHQRTVRALARAGTAYWPREGFRSVPISRSVWNDAPAGARETEERFYDSTVEKVGTAILVHNR